MSDKPQPTVHPHACGEHETHPTKPLTSCGSPPRMWGTPVCSWALPERVRFTPTHVGNTAIGGKRAARPPVHPHACGEHTMLPVHGDNVRGSPPRMWGTPQQPSPHCRTHRFTPTHVGNTMPSALTVFFPSVHPHACGEHGALRPYGHSKNGSPPRMWGTQLEIRSTDILSRFTPTHVGNTTGDNCGRRSRPVHPHECGEHLNRPCATNWLSGSPPRMWGTLLRRSKSSDNLRFTPTHVGNTVCSVCRYARLTVHPHACGEHTQLTSLRRLRNGSPPRMWGTPVGNSF